MSLRRLVAISVVCVQVIVHNTDSVDSSGLRNAAMTKVLKLECSLL